VDLGLDGKVAVVTGASKGIGLAASRTLADEGASVVAGARSAGSLDGLDGVTAVTVDLAAPDGPAQLVQRAVDDHGRVDVLVNNVGAVRLRLGGFLDTPDDEFAWAMELNFFTTLRATRAAIPVMIDQGGGAIVNIASVQAFATQAGVAAYAASKGGVVALVRSLAVAWAPRVRVNAVAPGWIATPLTEALRAPGGAGDTILARTPLGRWGDPEDVVGPVLFLCSDAARFVTGEVLRVDGGYLAA
jgi:NAD(P)-dependent dehydrogenase (short-subunit alcohol dehydrogenase family)